MAPKEPPNGPAVAGPAAIRFERAADMVVDGHVEALRSLLRDDSDLARARSTRNHGATLLHYAAANGVEDERQRTPANAVEIADLLIAAGADINATAKFYGGGSGSTPLVGLVTSGHPNRAGLMVELVHAYARSGQSLDGLDNDGFPMTLALIFRHAHAARALAEAGARIDNVALAAGVGRIDLVRAGVGVRGPSRPPSADPGGLKSFRGVPRTPEETVLVALHFAAIAGDDEVVRYLIDTGVNVNGTLSHDRTALHEAAWAGHADVVASLVGAGATADVRDTQFDATAVGWAAHGQREEIVRFLLDRAQVDPRERGSPERDSADA